MLAAAYGSVSDIEIFWVVLVFCGLLFSLYNVKEARADQKALKEAGVANGRGKIAQFAVRSEMARTAIQLIFLTIGILAMFLAETPDSLDQPWHLTAIGFAFRWGLITAAALITLKSYWSWRLRAILREQFRQAQEEVVQTTPVVGEVEVRTDELTGENTVSGTFGGAVNGTDDNRTQ